MPRRRLGVGCSTVMDRNHLIGIMDSGAAHVSQRDAMATINLPPHLKGSRPQDGPARASSARTRVNTAQPIASGSLRRTSRAIHVIPCGGRITTARRHSSPYGENATVHTKNKPAPACAGAGCAYRIRRCTETDLVAVDVLIGHDP